MISENKISIEVPYYYTRIIDCILQILKKSSFEAMKAEMDELFGAPKPKPTDALFTPKPRPKIETFRMVCTI